MAVIGQTSSPKRGDFFYAKEFAKCRAEWGVRGNTETKVEKIIDLQEDETNLQKKGILWNLEQHMTAVVT